MISLPRCPFCHEDVARGQVAIRVCPRCHAFHHEECWEEFRGCSSCAPVIKITRPAEPFAPPAGTTPAVATATPLVETPLAGAPGVDRAALRSRLLAVRRLRLLLAGVVLAVAGLAGSWGWSTWSRPRYHFDPAHAVDAYFAAYSATRARFERQSPTLDALSTPLSCELAQMEGGRFDEPLLDSTSSAEVSLQALTSEPVAARVVAGSRSFRLLPDGSGGWQLDRALSEAPVTALGVRLRLPLGLEHTSEPLVWHQGDLTAILARQELDGPLASAALLPRSGSAAMAERTIGVLQLEAGSGPFGSTVRREELPPRRLGAATRVFTSEDQSHESVAIGYVEVADGRVVSLELRGPGGHVPAIVELLRASLGTIEFFPESFPAPAPWVDYPLDDLAHVRVPPSFGRAGEKCSGTTEVPNMGDRWSLEAFFTKATPPGGVLETRDDAGAGPLGSRQIFLVPTYVEGRVIGQTWVLVAAGMVHGRGSHLVLSAPAGLIPSRVALERLERIANTYEVRTSAPYPVGK